MNQFISFTFFPVLLHVCITGIVVATPVLSCQLTQALRNGLFDIVKTSLLGSILSNVLLVLGTSFLCGGLSHRTENQHTRWAVGTSDSVAPNPSWEGGDGGHLHRQLTVAPNLQKVNAEMVLTLIA